MGLVRVAHRGSGIAVVAMDRGKVNAMNLPLLLELRAAMDAAVADDAVRGVVLTSALPTVFSAGLDMREFDSGDRPRLEKWWHAFQDAWLGVHACAKPCVVAVNGSAPAGGCAFVLAGDYRVMTRSDKAVIGVPAVLRNILIPPWFQDAMVRTVGERHAERLVNTGALLRPAEALGIGLVDALAEPDAVVDDAVAVAERMAAVPHGPWLASKMAMRRATIDLVVSRREQDTRDGLAIMENALTHKL